MVTYQSTILTANNDVGCKTEEHEDKVSDGTPSSLDNFEETVLSVYHQLKSELLTCDNMEHSS